jgi:hypothetical protein
MKNISLQYQDLQEGKMNRHQFLRNARMMFPNHVTQYNSFEDSIKILKSRGLLNEGNAVKGTPDKAPTYEYPNEETKYMKVVQEPEVDEQDGIYPATTLTDIPKEKMDKKVKDTSDGLEPIKDKDTKNELKKVKIVKEAKSIADERYGKLISKLSGGNKANIEKDWKTAGDDEVKKNKVVNKIKTFLNLKESIKTIVNEVLADMVDDYEEFTADTERNDDGGRPKMSELISTLVDEFDDFQKSNDIDLENEVKEDDLNNFISNYIDKIGYGMNDDYYNFLFYGVQDDLKRLGYKFI